MKNIIYSDEVEEEMKNNYSLLRQRPVYIVYYKHPLSDERTEIKRFTSLSSASRCRNSYKSERVCIRETIGRDSFAIHYAVVGRCPSNNFEDPFDMPDKQTRREATDMAKKWIARRRGRWVDIYRFGSEVNDHEIILEGVER